MPGHLQRWVKENVFYFSSERAREIIGWFDMEWSFYIHMYKEVNTFLKIIVRNMVLKYI